MAKEKMKNDTVVIGLGNTIMTDEGIGCAVVGHLIALKSKFPEIDFVEAGTGGMNLLHIISGRKKVIIIDCALMGAEPGIIKRFTPENVKSVKRLSHYSLHDVDVLKVIEMSRQLGECPEEIVIFGIEPMRIEHGRQLSETLSAKLEGYTRCVKEELLA
jgi:hydrogenase maturation protease